MPINLPDFDEMDALAHRAALAKRQIKALEGMRDILSGTFVRMAETQQEYWINGKKPNSTMLSRVYAKVGLTKEHYQQMSELNLQVADAYEEYELTTELLKTARNKIDIYRTQRADERKAYV